ncbi:MAG: hypothetical protein K0S44_1431 [Bacteroidetes bacterium]|jgi:hypothetical protein|nr:hypothetical protein [Bacteroidota bacterium]
MKLKTLDRIAILLSIVLLLLLSFILGSGGGKRTDEQHINKSEINNSSIKYTTTDN